MNKTAIVKRNNSISTLAARGAGMVEYVLILGLVALLCFAGFRFFGEKVNNKINAQGQAVNGTNDQAN
jgi:Flp pilus assembly pilin Flp